MKIRPVGAEFFQADRHVTEVVVAFGSFASAPNDSATDVKNSQYAKKYYTRMT